MRIYVPQIVDLNVQRRDAVLHLLRSRIFIVDLEVRRVVLRAEAAADDEVLLALLALERDLRVAIIIALLDERLQVRGAAQERLSSGVSYS